MAIKIYQTQVRPTGETAAVKSRRDQRISMDTATQIGRAVKGAAKTGIEFFKELEVRKSENEVQEKIKKLETGDNNFKGMIEVKEISSSMDDPDRAAKNYNEGLAIAKQNVSNFEHRYTKELFNNYLKKKELADGIDVRRSSNRIFLKKSASIDQEVINGYERRIVYPTGPEDQKIAYAELESHFKTDKFKNLHGANAQNIENKTRENIEFYTAKRIIKEKGIEAGQEYIKKTKYLNVDQIDQLNKYKKTTADGNSALINDTLKTFENMSEEGLLDQDGMAKIGAIIETHGTNKQKVTYQKVLKNYSIVSKLNNMSITQIDNFIKNARSELKPTKADPELFNTISIAEKYRAKVISDTKRDPITAASKRGVLDIENIDFAKMFTGNKEDRDSFIMNLKVRKNQSNVVSKFYGTPKKFFSEAETNTLTNFMDNMNDYNSIIRFTSAVTEGFGSDSPKVFSEIAKSNEFFAHVGGLSNINSNLPQIKLAIDGYLLQKNKIDVPMSKIDMEMENQKYANVFPDNNETYATVLDFAEKIYTAKANKTGAKVFNRKMYEDSIKEAFGKNGDFGGVSEYNGEMVHVPNWLKNDEFDNIIEFMKDDPDMIKKASSAMGYSDDFATEPDVKIEGKPVDRSDRAIDIFSDKPYFISVGYGRYKVALGDHPKEPNGNPQYVVDGNYISANSPYFIIDLNNIKDDYETRKR